jgi:hypothetical protein
MGQNMTKLRKYLGGQEGGSGGRLSPSNNNNPLEVKEWPSP